MARPIRPFSQFIDRPRLSENTRRHYRYALEEFFQTVTDPDVDDPDLDTKSVNFIEKLREEGEDDPGYIAVGYIEKYISSMKGLAPNTVRQKFMAVRSFLRYNRIPLNADDIKDLGDLSGGAVTEEHIPTRADIRSICNNVPLHVKLWILMMVSSGMRPWKAAFRLDLQDIDDKNIPTKVVIRPDKAKNKKMRYTFISKEATEVLHDWLRNREAWMVKNSHHIKNLDYRKAYLENYKDRLFPSDIKSFRYHWYKALEATGLDMRDPTNNRRKLRPHNFRKFFDQTFTAAGHTWVGEFLKGDSKAVKDPYKRSGDLIQEVYLLVEPSLTIFSPEIGDDVRATLSETRQDVINLYHQRDALKKDFEQKIKKLEQTNIKMLQRIAEYLEQGRKNYEELQQMKEWKENFIREGVPELTVAELKRQGKGKRQVTS